MNERLKELAEQAGIYYRTTSDEFCEADKDGVPLEMMERFADLVRQDYAKQFITDAERDENIRSEERKHCAKNYLKIMRDAVAKEREACARLVEEMASKCHDIRRAALEVAAENIRGRGNHEQA